MKNIKKKGISKSKMAVVGAGIAAIGAGAYYLMGPNDKAHQKKTAMLMTKIKKEVQSEIKKAEKVTTPLYHKVVDSVSKNYTKQHKAHEKDIKAFTKKLKSEWKSVTK